MDTTSLVPWEEKIDGATVPSNIFAVTSNSDQCFSISPCVRIIGSNQGLRIHYIEQTVDSSKWSGVNFGIDFRVMSFENENEYAFFETDCNGAVQTNKFMKHRIEPINASKCFFRNTPCNALIIRIGAYINGASDFLWISKVVYEDPMDGSTKSPTQQPTDLIQTLTISPTYFPTLLPSDTPSNNPTLYLSNNPTLNPGRTPTESPTLPCVEISLQINGAASFDASQFDGLYAANGQINGRRFWINKQAPNEKNIRFVNGKWIVNGIGTLYHLEISQKGEWIYSKDGSTGTGTMKCYWTAAPTINPTISPFASGQIDDLYSSLSPSFDTQPNIQIERIDWWTDIAIFLGSLLILTIFCFMVGLFARYKRNQAYVEEIAAEMAKTPQSPGSVSKDNVNDVSPGVINRVPSDDAIVLDEIIFMPDTPDMMSVNSEILYANEEGVDSNTTTDGIGSTDVGDV